LSCTRAHGWDHFLADITDDQQEHWYAYSQGPMCAILGFTPSDEMLKGFLSLPNQEKVHSHVLV
jgi:hypothetical protein